MNKKNLALNPNTNNINLIDFLKIQKENSPQERFSINDYLENTLGYKTSYSSITDKNRKKVSLYDVLNDFQQKIEKDNNFFLDINIVELFKDYIDFENTNINISFSTNTTQDQEEILSKLPSCKKRLNINWLQLYSANNLDWISKLDNIEIFENSLASEDIFSISTEEFLDRFKTFKKYIPNHTIDLEDYNYFIKHTQSICRLQDFDNLKQKEHWLEDNQYPKPVITLLISPYELDDLTQNKLSSYSNSDSYNFQISLPSKCDLCLEDLRNIEKLQQLGAKSDFQDKTKQLYTNTFSEVDENSLEKFNISEIVIGSKENSNASILSPSQYKILRYTLDSIVSDIEPSLPEQDKFKAVYSKLAHMITYDYEAIDEKTEYAKENANKCRNTENALLCGKAVCAGYAETLKQALSLVNIESHYISSQPDSDNDTHAYNIVKINGNWYNADLTWDYEYIRNKTSPKYCLKSDKDFKKTSKDNKPSHTPKENLEFSCDKSLDIYPEYKKSHFLTNVKIVSNLILQATQKKLHSLKNNLFKDKDNLSLQQPNTTPSISDNKKEFKVKLKEGTPSQEEQHKYIENLTFSTNTKQTKNKNKNENENEKTNESK